ncbi:hypothetical protein P7K49_016876 [Saguinus oedipus]|uniref:Uncharacterized protein n=1 Tax=Saguinus oedipus TaxID=9490 RepID=A0ABQ9VGA5_SAGOE|nr:hypothetical protein P7K49_016876 [Saguinus oedipus]
MAANHPPPAENEKGARPASRAERRRCRLLPPLTQALATSPPREEAMVVVAAAAWLLLWAAACAQLEQDFYNFQAVNIRGKLVSLEKYRGSVSARGLAASRGPASPWPGPLNVVAPRAPRPRGRQIPAPAPLSCDPRRGASIPRPARPAATWHGPVLAHFATGTFGQRSPHLRREAGYHCPAFAIHGWKK